MASATLTGLLSRYPAGTTLNVYLRPGGALIPDGRAPSGNSITSASVTTSGTATFTGLAPSQSYVAYALVSTEHRYTSFSADPADVFSVDSDGMFSDGSDGVWLRSRNALNVLDYGAAGDSTGDDSTAIQAAIDDANAAGGGAVLLPAGTYRCLNEITLKETVGLLGEGQGGTIISFPTDLGDGVVGITMEGLQIDGAWMRSLHIQGSGSYAIGVQNCDMDGVQPGQSSKLTDVSVYGFRAAIRIVQDHQIFTNCKFANSYYGVLFDDEVDASAGNQQFYSCFIEGNNFACIAVLGRAIIDYCLFMGGNAAFAPYGFYKADGPVTGASQRGLMSNTLLDHFAFENIGNAVIWDESTGSGSGLDTLVSCRINNPGLAWNAACAITGRSTDYAVKLRYAVDTTIVMGSGQFRPFDPAVGHAFHVPAASDLRIEMSNSRYPGDTSNLFSPASAVGIEVVRKGQWSARTMRAVGAISAGDVLEVATAASDAVQRYSGFGTPFAGVAVEGAADGDLVVVARDGFVDINVEGSPVQGQALRPDTTTQHHCAIAPSHGSSPTTGIATKAPIIGYARSASGGAQVSARLTPVPDSYFVKPSNVTALPAASSTYRGQLARIEGGVGVADGLYICQKKADNTYAWQQVTVT